MKLQLQDPYLKLKALDETLRLANFSGDPSSSASLSFMSCGFNESAIPLIRDRRPTKLDKNGLKKHFK